MRLKADLKSPWGKNLVELVLSQLNWIIFSCHATIIRIFTFHRLSLV